MLRPYSALFLVIILISVSGFIPTTIRHHSFSASTSKMRASNIDLTESELKSILSVAASAAKKAGDIIVSHSGGADVTKTKANPRDLLTLIDPLCEEIIKETVLSAFPTHDFLGEEDVPPGKEASAAALDAKLNTDKDFLWIVDVSKQYQLLQKSRDAFKCTLFLTQTIHLHFLPIADRWNFKFCSRYASMYAIRCMCIQRNCDCRSYLRSSP